MTHDPLCHYRPEQVCAHCKCVTSYSIRCTCALILKVRADEREQAAERVFEAIGEWIDLMNSMYGKASWPAGALQRVTAAARGEQA